MRTALIGYTGFVGSNIATQSTFDDYFNSQNITDIEGREYDLVLSAANKADMWRINQEGDKDRAEIEEYLGHIKKAKIKKLVLISTVGVYKSPNGADEDTQIDVEGLAPYGVNRYYLERECAKTFDTTIIRLPGLFGDGLKKNVIFDLLHNNMVEKIHHAGVYQYYNLSNIWRDIEIALREQLSLVNFATEPVQTDEVAAYCIDIKDFDQEPQGVNPAHWDMHSKHADVYGGAGAYLYSKQQVLEDIRAFVDREKESK